MKIKKLLYAGLCLAFAFSLMACGGKKKEESKESNISDTLNTADAMVQRRDGDYVLVELDDGRTLTVDVSHAKMSKAWGVETGDEVEIGFEGDELTDGMSAEYVTMVTPYEAVSEEFFEDRMVYGTVTDIQDKKITVLENDEMLLEEDDGPVNGEEYEFTRTSFETVLGSPKKGDTVLVYYIGYLDEEPQSYRIVTEDKMDDPESDSKEIKGSITQIDGNIISLQTDEGRVFYFDTNGDEDLLKKAEKKMDKTATAVFYDNINMRVLGLEDLK